MKSPDTMTREELEEEVAFLRGELGVVQETTRLAVLKHAFGMEAGQARMILALFNAGGKTLSTDQIEYAITQNVHRDRDYGNIANVYACRIRKKLGAEAIQTVWGRGYALTPAGVAMVQAALNPARAAA